MIAEQFIQELTDEAPKTRRALERIPESELTWAPHPKSLTIGQLGWHLAVLPRAITDLLSELERDAPNVPRPQPTSGAEILAAFDENIPYAANKIAEWGDAGLQQIWTLKFQGRAVFQIPRIAAVRAILLNHTYHHRGQLTVYLRLLDVPVPSIFGPSADENPFIG
ncbi:MAG TPA: DinB family protein [Thermoanaerobaculia bacterium]|jgi:uncharacterized damage-inducible protein DinB